MVRLAIQAGVDPMTAIQMATINSAEAYRIDHLVGSICPGRIADILFVDGMESFNVKKVMTNGKMVAENGKICYDLKAPARSSVLNGELKCNSCIQTCKILVYNNLLLTKYIFSFLLFLYIVNLVLTKM